MATALDQINITRLQQANDEGKSWSIAVDPRIILEGMGALDHPSQKQVYLTIVLFCLDATNKYMRHPTIDDLCVLSGLDTGSIRAALYRMRKAGVLRFIPEKLPRHEWESVQLTFLLLG